MDYYNRIQRSIDFIEENLNEEIELVDIASKSGFSLYHLYRMFQPLTGYSIKEYIRKRRLTLSAYLLLYTNKSILDIALECQYNTHESFSRAFKKEFNINPKIFRKNKTLLNLHGKVDLFLLKKIKNGNGGISLKPVIKTIDSFYVIGVELQTTMENNKSLQQIPEFWKKFHEHKLKDGIPDKNNDSLLGICRECVGNSYKYVIGSRVSSLENIPDGYVGFTIPEGKYAIFTSKGKFPDSVQALWSDIYRNWLPESGYELSGQFDYELYDERSILDTPECDIYISLK